MSVAVRNVQLQGTTWLPQPDEREVKLIAYLSHLVRPEKTGVVGKMSPIILLLLCPSASALRLQTTRRAALSGALATTITGSLPAVAADDVGGVPSADDHLSRGARIEIGKGTHHVPFSGFFGAEQPAAPEVYSCEKHKS